MSRLFRLFLPPLILALAASLASAAEPAVIHLQTLRAQMRFSQPEIDTTPGTPIKILFENTDDMPHNLVFCQPGTDVVAMSNKQLEKPDDAVKRNFQPDDPAIWQHSKLLNPHEKEELSFTAPEKPGDYPYVCTMPGHAMSMRGLLRVLEPGKKLAGLAYKLYQGDWDRLPDFSKLEPHLQGELSDGLIQLDMSDSKVNYGVVFTGKINAPVTGEYTFYVDSDDGSRISIDGKQVTEYNGVHPAGEIHEGKTRLATGDHDFRLEYFQKQNEAVVYAGWKGPNFGITALSKWRPDGWNATSKGKKDDHTGIPLVVDKEPIIYRNFISGAGTRGIGVGYPGGFNIAWSAQSLNLAVVWRGAFIDAARHWTDRGGGYQPPLGYDVIQPVDGLNTPFAIPSGGAIAWQRIRADERAEDYQWKGYHLDEKRFPTFFYEWKGVKVSDRFDITGNAVNGDGKLVRTLKLEGKIPEGAVFRAATGKVEPAGADFQVKGPNFKMDGRDFDNSFVVSAPGAEKHSNDVVLPAQPEIKVTYSWPMEQMQHSH